MKVIHIKNFLFIPLYLCICLVALSGCGDSLVQVSIIPSAVTVPRDQTFQFTLQVANTQDAQVNWSIDNDNGFMGSMDPYNRGIYTPPAVIPTPNTIKVRVTSQADTNASDTASVTVVSGNTLQFGTNTQITNYGVPPPSCAAGTTSVASTASSGQHSIKIFQKTVVSTNPLTYVFMVWADNHLNNPNNDIFFRQIIFDPNNTDPTKQMVCSSIIRVNASGFAANRINPSLAVNTNGNVYVAWQDNRNPSNPGTAKSDFDIYVAKGSFDNTPSGGTGTPPNGIGVAAQFSSDVRFDDDPGTSDQQSPSIAVTADGINVYVAWQDNRNSNYDIRAAVGSPTGTTPSSYVVSGTTTTDQTEPSVALFELNHIENLYIAWTGAQSSGSGIYFTKGFLASNSWSAPAPVLVNDPGAADRSQPSLAVDSRGYAYVAWQDNRNGNNDIFFAKSTNGGTTFDGVTVPTNPTKHNIRVTDDTGSADHRIPSIVMENPESNAAASTPDKIYVAWQDNRNHSTDPSIFDIFTAKSTNGGSIFQKNSAQANLPPGNKPTSNASIAVDGFGRTYLIWTDERNNTGTPGTASDIFFVVGQ
jgi:hypothetical protein